MDVDEWRLEMKQLVLETDDFEIATALKVAREEIKQVELESDDFEIATAVQIAREELKEIETDWETKTDVLDIAASLENANLGSPRKPEGQENIKTTQDADPESDADQHDDEEEEEGVLLFRVGLALEADDDYDNIHVVLMHLEDLRDLAPELLTKFLQSKLRFIEEDALDDQEIR